MMTEKEIQMKAEAYCSACERCRSEVAAKIAAYSAKCPEDELDSDATERIITHLEREGYLNEERYAQTFVHDKLRFCKWGRLKIKAVLRQKGVAPDAVRQALDAIDPDEYACVLRDVIASRKRDIKGASDYERSMRLLRFLSQRGFEPSIASEFINLTEED